ncbi:centrosomal protein of 164 kDa-like isoform X4 [Portunus trituberculatus]|uniref:centrosomal protein of 164 kDa-like isoform X4 n=1 Tax=Portunus trituberculatus TaxID=210409 RepID=UPI001E1CF6ED|nr:centrosomal protein of 164 kDa-like isoform X4 [Portunus trituberculatus]
MSRPEGEAAAAGDTCRQTLLQEVFDQDYHVTDQDVAEYCEKLGISIEERPHLLPLARAALLHPLPSRWTPVEDPKLGLYFFNHRTGESRWSHPIDTIVRALITGENNNAPSADSLTEELDEEELQISEFLKAHVSDEKPIHNDGNVPSEHTTTDACTLTSQCLRASDGPPLRPSTHPSRPCVISTLNGVEKESGEKKCRSDSEGSDGGGSRGRESSVPVPSKGGEGNDHADSKTQEDISVNVKDLNQKEDRCGDSVRESNGKECEASDGNANSDVEDSRQWTEQEHDHSVSSPHRPSTASSSALGPAMFTGKDGLGRGLGRAPLGTPSSLATPPPLGRPSLGGSLMGAARVPPIGGQLTPLAPIAAASRGGPPQLAPLKPVGSISQQPLANKEGQGVQSLRKTNTHDQHGSGRWPEKQAGGRRGEERGFGDSTDRGLSSPPKSILKGPVLARGSAGRGQSQGLDRMQLLQPKETRNIRFDFRTDDLEFHTSEEEYDEELDEEEEEEEEEEENGDEDEEEEYEEEEEYDSEAEDHDDYTSRDDNDDDDDDSQSEVKTSQKDLQQKSQIQIAQQEAEVSELRRQHETQLKVLKEQLNKEYQNLQEKLKQEHNSALNKLRDQEKKTFESSQNKILQKVKEENEKSLSEAKAQLEEDHGKKKKKLLEYLQNETEEELEQLKIVFVREMQQRKEELLKEHEEEMQELEKDLKELYSQQKISKQEEIDATQAAAAARNSNDSAAAAAAAAVSELELSMAEVLRQRQTQIKREHNRQLATLEEKLDEELEKAARQAKERETVEKRNHSARLTALKDEHERELSELEDSHARHIQDLEADHEADVGKLKSEFRAELMIQKTELENKLTEFRIEYEQKMDSLAQEEQPEEGGEACEEKSIEMNDDRKQDDVMNEVQEDARATYEDKTGGKKRLEDEEKRYDEILIELQERRKSLEGDLEELKAQESKVKELKTQHSAKSHSLCSKNSCIHETKYNRLKAKYSSLVNRIKSKKAKRSSRPSPVNHNSASVSSDKSSMESNGNMWDSGQASTDLTLSTTSPGPHRPMPHRSFHHGSTSEASEDEDVRFATEILEKYNRASGQSSAWDLQAGHSKHRVTTPVSSTPKKAWAEDELLVQGRKELRRAEKFLKSRQMKNHRKMESITAEDIHREILRQNAKTRHGRTSLVYGGSVTSDTESDEPTHDVPSPASDFGLDRMLEQIGSANKRSQTRLQQHSSKGHRAPYPTGSLEFGLNNPLNTHSSAGPLHLEHLTSGSVPDLGPETVDRVANINHYLQQRWTSYFGELSVPLGGKVGWPSQVIGQSTFLANKAAVPPTDPNIPEKQEKRTYFMTDGKGQKPQENVKNVNERIDDLRVWLQEAQATSVSFYDK